MPNTASIDLVTLLDHFGSEDACREYMEKLRWPSGVCCPRCGDTSVSEISTRDQWDCNSCRYRFSVTSGTIFDNTKLSLRKWFVAVHLMAQAKKGMSALQLQRTLGIGSYKTAWYLCHRVREAMEGRTLEGPTLVGVVEVDETRLGGYRRTPKGEKRSPIAGKVLVAGAIQRGGMLRLERIPNVRKQTLHDFIRRTVKDEADAIYTDELMSYFGVEDSNTVHQKVNHSAEEWVVGDVHTNSIEQVWSLLKRSIMGSFHKISVKHLDRYLEELEWRFNNRANPFIFRDLLVRLMEGDALRYRELVA